MRSGYQVTYHEQEWCDGGSFIVGRSSSIGNDVCIGDAKSCANSRERCINYWKSCVAGRKMVWVM